MVAPKRAPEPSQSSFGINPASFGINKTSRLNRRSGSAYDPNLGPALAPGDVIECQYRLLDFDLLENLNSNQSAKRPPRRLFGVLEQDLAGTETESRAFEIPKGKRRRNQTVQNETSLKIKAIENSVLWQTAGRGDTDFGVHFFERRKVQRNDGQLLYQPYLFRTVCPNSPLTFAGQLISIGWMVRVRVFLDRGDCMTFEQNFRLSV